jgi:peptidoglycan/xylan/chitin deacetylase (PgdA/CDA1 family)
MQRRDLARNRRTQRANASPNRRGRDLPLPLLLLLAIVAVGAERLGRRGIIALIPALLVCVALAAVAPRLATRTADQPAITAVGDSGAAQAPGDPAQPVAAPEGVATAEPAVAGAAPAAAAVPTGVGGEPNALASTVAPTVPPAIVPTAGPTPTAKTQPRATTVIPILMYHYVRTVNDPADQVGINLSVRPELFDAQMRYLAENGYTTLTMQEVHAILNGQKTLPAKPIALTFDDGYRDFYTNAWPILNKYGLKATNYVVTDFIGWEQYMSWPMLQELDVTGQIEFGAHTRSHPDLRAISAERRWDEIIGSKAILEQGLGHPIGAFCYPAGFYNAAVIADVKRANYLTATTVEPGTKQNIQSAFEMPRIRVNGPDTINTWIGKLP